MATPETSDRQVTFDEVPERVVSLAPSVTEMIFAAGGGHLLVGVSTADDFPAAVDTLPRVSSHPINVEAVVDLEPDLILASEQVNAARDAEVFAAVGIPTFFLTSQTIEDIVDSIGALGSLLGTEQEAKAAASSLHTQLEQLRAATDTVSHRPRTLFLIGDETLYSFGKGSYVHDLIQMAGGQSMTADLDVRNPLLSDEFVLEAEPDVIIGGFGTDYDPKRLRRLHPTWQDIPAVAEGRVYSVDPSIVVRPGPRIVKGAWKMAELLHGIQADTVSASSIP